MAETAIKYVCWLLDVQGDKSHAQRQHCNVANPVFTQDSCPEITSWAQWVTFFFNTTHDTL